MSVESILTVSFFLTENGNEPVREWLKDMEKEDRKLIGEDILLVQFRWPLGMPLVRKMETNLWEVRSKLQNGNISRVFFTIFKSEMILLHGIIKKSQKTPKKDIELARSRKNQWLSEVSL
jgi:phage-related protein